MKRCPVYLSWWTLFLLLAATFPLNAFAVEDSGDLALLRENIILSDATIVHNQKVRLYATVVSNDFTQDLLGSVQFKNETTGNRIGTDQAVSVLAGKTDIVFVDWRPPAGTYSLSVTLVPWKPENDDSSNNKVIFPITVDYDYDNDNIGNKEDSDDDNDGVPDNKDAFPLNSNESIDTDGDGIGDNSDPNDDNDALPDESDALPQNPAEIEDADEDQIGNNADTDDDNDGLPDTFEVAVIDPQTGERKEATNPQNPDTDGDGFSDGPVPLNSTPSSAAGSESNPALISNVSATPDSSSELPNPSIDTAESNQSSPVATTPSGPPPAGTVDAFPADPTEWADTDHDGIGDNRDPDDENDGIPDNKDSNPKNKGPVILVEEEETSATLEDLEELGLTDLLKKFESIPRVPGEIPTIPGVRIFAINASKSFDPDGDSSKLVYRWLTKDGRLLGEKAVLKLRIGTNTILPASLMIIDENGESRIFNLNLGEKTGLKTLGWSLLVALLIALAITGILKYRTRGSKPALRKKAKHNQKTHNS